MNVKVLFLNFATKLRTYDVITSRLSFLLFWPSWLFKSHFFKHDMLVIWLT